MAEEPILTFYKPERVFKDLQSESGIRALPDLIKHLKQTHQQEKLELCFGAILATGFAHVARHSFVVRTPKNDPPDVELVDLTLWEQNQSLPDNQREPDHWRVENVSITEHAVREKLEHGIVNFYEIIASHLERTKLFKSKYQGMVLSFYFQLNLQGFSDIRKLREQIRAISQNNFKQIWIWAFSSPQFDQCSVVELLQYDWEIINFPVPT